MTNYVVNAEPGRYVLQGNDVQFYVHQRRALARHTQTPARMCAERDGDEQAALFVATFLTAAAAAEAILSETAHDKFPTLYSERTFRQAGAPAKYGKLFGEPAPAQLELLWNVRKDLQHSEPDNPRAGERGAHLTIQGAAEAAAFVLELFDKAAVLQAATRT